MSGAISNRPLKGTGPLVLCWRGNRANSCHCNCQSFWNAPGQTGLLEILSYCETRELEKCLGDPLMRHGRKSRQASYKAPIMERTRAATMTLSHKEAPQKTLNSQRMHIIFASTLFRAILPSLPRPRAWKVYIYSPANQQPTRSPRPTHLKMGGCIASRPVRIFTKFRSLAF